MSTAFAAVAAYPWLSQVPTARLDRALVITDNRGTLTDPAHLELPPLTVPAIQKLLEGGGKIVVVTGEALEDVKRSVFNHIGRVPPDSFVVISALCHQLNIWRGDRFEAVATFRGLPFELQREIVEHKRAVLADMFGSPFNFAADVYVALKNGDSIWHPISLGSHELYFAGYPTMITVGFRASDKAPKELVADLHSRLAEKLTPLIGPGVHLTFGGWYVECAAGHKGDGMDLLLACGVVDFLRDRDGDVLLAGDSPNDLRLLDYQFPLEFGARTTRLFVGTDPKISAALSERDVHFINGLGASAAGMEGALKRFTGLR